MAKNEYTEAAGALAEVFSAAPYLSTQTADALAREVSGPAGPVAYVVAPRHVIEGERDWCMLEALHFVAPVTARALIQLKPGGAADVLSLEGPEPEKGAILHQARKDLEAVGVALNTGRDN